MNEKRKDDNAARLIVAECDAIKAMLLEKNRLYGNSALSPIRTFSKADAIEQINVRLDDKLSRMASAQGDDYEDAEMDFVGYLILKRVARKIAGASGIIDAQLAQLSRSPQRVTSVGFGLGETGSQGGDQDAPQQGTPESIA